MKLLYVTAALLAIGLAACDKNEETVEDNRPVAAQISAGVNVPQTRANDDQWEADAIGVMVTNAPSSTMEDLYKNVQYTTSAITATAANFSAAGEGIFFQDATETVTFAAYGPYQSSAANALPGTDGVISGSTADQSTREKQKAFDYIYASGATASRSTPTVQFQGDNHQFTHKMTRLIIIVKTSTQDGFTADQVTDGKYSLIGLNHSGQFDVTTGTATATGSATTDEWSLTDKSLKKDGETEQVTFTSILYPQTLGSALTFNAVIDGQTYTNNADINPELKAGFSYTYTITAKKEKLTVNGCKIDNWGTGDTGSGNATMQ